MRVVYLRAARTELREAVRYYNGQISGLGYELLKEVRTAITRIKAMPLAWHPLDDEVRRCQAKRFPYGVIYQVEENIILIVAIAHLHREPEYWRDRL